MNDQEQEQKQFSQRDEIAKKVFETFLNQWIDNYEMKEFGDVDEFGGIEDWLKDSLDQIAMISYHAADSMRKARLASFK